MLGRVAGGNIGESDRGQCWGEWQGAMLERVTGGNVEESDRGQS